MGDSSSLFTVFWKAEVSVVIKMGNKCLKVCCFNSFFALMC